MVIYLRVKSDMVATVLIGNTFLPRDAKNILFKIKNSDFKNQLLEAKIGKMLLIFHYISYKFDKILYLKNQI
jgi:hypothetical protein